MPPGSGQPSIRFRPPKVAEYGLSISATDRLQNGSVIAQSRVNVRSHCTHAISAARSLDSLARAFCRITPCSQGRRSSLMTNELLIDMHKKAISLSDLTVRGHVGRIEAFVFLLSCPSSVPERYSLSPSRNSQEFLNSFSYLSVSCLPSKVNLPLLPLSRRSWSKYRPSGRGGRPVAQGEQTLKPSPTSDLESGSGDRRAGSQASRILSDKISRRYMESIL